MFDAPYPFSYIMTKAVEPTQAHLNTKLYRFTSDQNHTYLVEVEEYIGKVYMVKFFLKNHRNSPDRFHLMTDFGSAQKVIFTVIHIMLEIFQANRTAHPSFAFMGSNTIYGDGRPDEDKANTKRFRSYKSIMSIFFGVETFEYIKDENASILIMKNRAAKIDIQMSNILKYIYQNYEILEINLISED